MIDHKFPIVIAVCTLVLAIVALSVLVWIGFATNIWDVGLMGLYITSLALAVGVLVAAESIRAGIKQYKKLSEKIEANARKLDTIACRQEELIALVKSTIQTSQDEDSSAESPNDANDQQ